jgi:3-hydroxyacyl-[acyl-carrier-protein] dehydratase
MATITSIEQGVLKQSLLSLSATENGGVEGIFSFPPDFPAFAGHFPGQPVLPAVVQVAAVRLLAAKHLQRKLTPASLSRAKFKSMVGPGEPVKVSILLDQSADSVTISFSIATEEKKISSGEIICRY